MMVQRCASGETQPLWLLPTSCNLKTQKVLLYFRKFVTNQAYVNRNIWGNRTVLGEGVGVTHRVSLRASQIRFGPQL